MDPGTSRSGLNNREACPCCGESRNATFLFAEAVPVQNTTLFRDPRRARAVPLGDLDIRVCHGCGLIFNAAFEESLDLYDTDYEETQGFSPTFRAFHRRVAETVRQRYCLEGRRILEIGCGKGEFLALLCENGANTGVGLDPAFLPHRHPDPGNPALEFRNEWFRRGDRIEDFDLVCSKMTLEHIPSVSSFMQALVEGLGSRPCGVFFQVPETRRILREVAFWDIFYEHCAYFTRESLAYLFAQAGLRVDEVWTDFDDQYLLIAASWEGKPSPRPARPDPRASGLLDAVSAFRKAFGELRQSWLAHFRQLRESGRRLVIWGGASKTVSFLSFVGTGGVVEAAVDINPNKQGTFLPGTGLPILAPEALPAYRPDQVLVMNPVYTEEIRAELERVGCFPELIDINRYP